MENKYQDSEIEITEKSTLNLKTGAGWAMFCAICYAILIAAGVILVTIASTAAAGTSYYFSGLFERETIGILMLVSFTYLLILVVSTWFLVQYSRKIRSAIKYTNQQDFHNSWTNLLNYFRIIGVVALLYTLFNLFSMIMQWTAPGPPEIDPF